MSLKAKDVLQTAAQLLIDEDNTRWTLPELAGYLNDGLLEVANKKPTATSTTITINLKQGTLQSIDTKYNQFLRAVRNISNKDGSDKGGMVITTVDRATLDAVDPYWHDESFNPPRTDVRHFIFDETDPYAFYVYPPNSGNGRIEVVVSKVPAKVEPNGSVDSIDSYNVTVDIRETYKNTLIDYVMYRAHSKDNQIASSAQRAVAYYQQFMNSLGLKLQNEMRMSPNMKASGATAQ